MQSNNIIRHNKHIKAKVFCIRALRILDSCSLHSSNCHFRNQYSWKSNSNRDTFIDVTEDDLLKIYQLATGRGINSNN